EVLGLGVMTDTPGRARSFQSRIALGLPLRTRNTIVEVYGELLLGRRRCQSTGSSLARWTISSMSWANASVPTSASSPSMTARAWRPEPPCDCLIATACPLGDCHWATNALLRCSDSVRVV